MYYTIDETRGALKAGKITSVQLVQNAIDTFNKDKSASIPLNAFNIYAYSYRRFFMRSFVFFSKGMQ